MRSPKAYVIRIYAIRGTEATGVVEEARTGRRGSFRDKDELWMFLRHGVRTARGATTQSARRPRDETND